MESSKSSSQTWEDNLWHKTPEQSPDDFYHFQKGRQEGVKEGREEKKEEGITIPAMVQPRNRKHSEYSGSSRDKSAE